VGGGQLALMMGEAAEAAGVRLHVLGAPGDPAAATCEEFLVGGPRDAAALARLAEGVDVVTFDHELVDLAQVADLARRVAVRPSAAALAFASDKAHQRRVLSGAGFAVPEFRVVADPADEALAQLARAVGERFVVKSARGGYDGRGVWFVDGLDATRRLVGELASEVVVEERLDLLGEAAQVVVRGATGEVLAYPLVSTIQRDGMCVETSYPSSLGDEAAAEAARIGARLAKLTGVAGVLAVELFVTDRGLVVNELATRPHNTAHWTIEGCATSQFENHLRAVAGLPLGPVEPVVEAAVMVNVVGGDEPADPDAARALPGIALHDYAKAWRPGRKIGHVTAVGDDVDLVRVRAWAGVAAYGGQS
jgi:5-(carboxyamino)imidazole ribonucleotide synthase